MKIKILPMAIVLIMIFSSINVFAVSLNDRKSESVLEISEEVHISSFTNLALREDANYLSIELEEATKYISSPGKPMLPVISKTYSFPFGTDIKDVECSFSEIRELLILDKIKPCPYPMPLTSIKDYIIDEKSRDELVYSSSELYPNEWYDYKINAGLDGFEHIISVTVNLYPVRYNPLENKLNYIDDFDIKISYEKGVSPIPKESDYDLLIITPNEFVLRVLPLKRHKEEMGLSTKIKTTESILRTAQGRDDAEKIKYFIKDAIESWGIKYVLLIGGIRGIGMKWHVPVRYSKLNDRGGWNETYLSDLYFSDIYKGEAEFEDWDSNENGVFAEWTFVWDPVLGWWYELDKRDIIDLHPDVYLGRLACKNRLEVSDVVNKIIKYERTTYGKEWFKDMLVFGGDTTPPPWGDPDIFEGEVENELAASYMEPLGFNVKRIWASNGNLTDNQDVIKAVSNGSGFMYFSGHGSPIIWSTHEANNETWIDGLFRDDIEFLENKEKLPICIVGGCHNSEFDVAFINMVKGILKYGLGYFVWSPDKNCYGKVNWIKRTWSWMLVSHVNGGSIATIGNTGLGWGSSGYNCIESLDGWITTHFFDLYSQKESFDNCSLGLVHSQTISDYVDYFDVNDEGNEKHRKTVEQWALLGDPSLKIGGYSS